MIYMHIYSLVRCNINRADVYDSSSDTRTLIDLSNIHVDLTTMFLIWKKGCQIISQSLER